MNLAISAAALLGLLVLYESCVRLPGPVALRRFLGVVGTVSIVFAADCVDVAYAPELGNSWVWPWLIATLVWVVVRAMFFSKPTTSATDSGELGGEIEVLTLGAESSEEQRASTGRWTALAGLGIVFGAIIAIGVQTAPAIAAKVAADEAASASESAARTSSPSDAQESHEEQRLELDGPFIYARTEGEPSEQVPAKAVRVSHREPKKHPADRMASRKVRSMSNAALVRCLSGPKDSDAGRCAEWLARTRPKALAESMKSLDPERASELLYWAPTPIDELRRMEKTFQDIGVFAATRSVTAEPPFPVNRDELFEWQGAELVFDVETGSFPNAHHFLLADIASMARGALDGTAFEEIAPENYDGDEAYTLRAYQKGLVYSVQAENNGDWYDLYTVLGLVNTLLREVESDLRVASLYTGDQVAQVVVAPEEAILAAFADGLLRSDRGEAEATVAEGTLRE